ncbi:MAG: SGNH/GDSL hydrolase family protein, partial [Bacteroidota bacterium]
MTIMTPSGSRKLQRSLAIVGLALAVNLWPDCFQYTAAVARLSSVEQTALSFLALTLALFSLATWWQSTRGRAVRRRTIAWMTFLLLIGIEMSGRWSYRLWADEPTRAAVEELTDRATPGRMIFTGHPYVHYTGVPNKGFNNRGFHGSDWAREKPAGVFRVACIGGSTTARGYPADLEAWLNTRADTVFEVLNVGLGGWTTAHSVANFVLNVVDYNPDLVVIHHAWNDVV